MQAISGFSMPRGGSFLIKFLLSLDNVALKYKKWTQY